MQRWPRTLCSAIKVYQSRWSRVVRETGFVHSTGWPIELFPRNLTNWHQISFSTSGTSMIYWNATFALMSTKPREQPHGSPCTHTMESQHSSQQHSASPQRTKTSILIKTNHREPATIHTLERISNRRWYEHKMTKDAKGGFKKRRIGCFKLHNQIEPREWKQNETNSKKVSSVLYPLFRQWILRRWDWGGSCWSWNWNCHFASVGATTFGEMEEGQKISARSVHARSVTLTPVCDNPVKVTVYWSLKKNLHKEKII